MSTRFALLVGAASTVVLAMAGVPVKAQENSKLAMEEIVVTARKRAETLEDVPIAIEAMGTQKIEENGIDSVARVAQYSASLTYDTGVLPNDTRPVIRGVSSNRGRANVATLVDDIDVTSEALTVGGGGMTANMRLMDLQQVEIIKGPQSVVYGRSAFSGAINYVTRRPSDTFEGQLDVNADEHDTYEGKLSVSGPITDTLKGRLNFTAYDTDGWYDNPNTGNDLGGGDMQGAALALEWNPSDVFSAYTRVEYSDEHYQPRATVLKRSTLNDPIGNFGTGVVSDSAEHLPYEFDAATVAYCADPASRQQPFASAIGIPNSACWPKLSGKMVADENDIDISPKYGTNQELRGTKVQNFRSSLDLSWALSDNLELRSLTGWLENKSNIREDFDLTNYTMQPLDALCGPGCSQYGLSAQSNSTHELQQISQELRVLGDNGPFTWFVSALYWGEELDTDWDDVFWEREGSFPAGGVTAPAYNTPTTNLSRDTDHWSIAASTTWSITDTLNLTVEGRYLDEDINYNGDNEDRGAYSLTAGAACDFTFSNFAPCGTSKSNVNETHFVPRITMDWQATEQTMLYATYSEGFKPGGVDTTDANGDVSVGEYKPEELKFYEIGNKNVLADGAVVLNASVFYYDYTDQQQSIQADTGSGITTTTVVNAGEASIKGVDVDFTWLAMDGLTISMGYVYSDASFEDFNLSKIAAGLGDGVVVKSPNNIADSGNAEGKYDGNQLPLSAEHTAVWSVRYEALIAEQLTGFTEVNGSYQSKRYLSAGNRSYLPSYDIWNFSVGADAESWRLILYVDNLFDDDTIRSGTKNTDYGFLPDIGFGGFAIPDASNLVLPQPRTFGARATYRF